VDGAEAWKLVLLLDVVGNERKSPGAWKGGVQGRGGGIAGGAGETAERGEGGLGMALSRDKLCSILRALGNYGEGQGRWGKGRGGRRTRRRKLGAAREGKLRWGRERKGKLTRGEPILGARSCGAKRARARGRVCTDPPGWEGEFPVGHRRSHDVGNGVPVQATLSLHLKVAKHPHEQGGAACIRELLVGDGDGLQRVDESAHEGFL